MAKCIMCDYCNDRFYCEYDINNERIKVYIDYDIEKEFMTEDGIYIECGRQLYSSRDIVILDLVGNHYYYLINAIYIGKNTRAGLLDVVNKSVFIAHRYIEVSSQDNLSKIIDERGKNKVSKIQLHSKELSRYVEQPSVIRKKTDIKTVIELLNLPEKSTIEIMRDNVKNIELFDYWKCEQIAREKITIDIEGILSINLNKCISIVEAEEYIYEALLYVQLYCGFPWTIDKVSLFIGDNQCKYIFPLRPRDKEKIKVKLKQNEKTLLDFIKICYEEVHYRSGNAISRNIPYVVMYKQTSIEEEFLMNYRFIEAFYKAFESNVNGYEFINDSVCKYYHNKIDNIEKWSMDVVKLRNHYVHSGYYLSNNILVYRHNKEKYQTIIDKNWLLFSVNVLLEISFAIIYTEILKCNEYMFTEKYVRILK